jgi:hypothetical protein
MDVVLDSVKHNNSELILVSTSKFSDRVCFSVSSFFI